MARASKGKTIPLPRTINLSTGKESMRQTGFSDVSWGKVTRDYALSARSLADTKVDAIIQDAKEFLKPIRSRNKATNSMEIINIDDDGDDERAHLIDYSDDEWNWLDLRKYIFVSLPFVTSSSLTWLFRIYHVGGHRHVYTEPIFFHAAILIPINMPDSTLAYRTWPAFASLIA